MGIRRVTAVGILAVALIGFLYMARGTHLDEAAAPGRDADKYTVKQIPSTPDRVTPP